MTAMEQHWGGIEAGGTKFICAAGTSRRSVEFSSPIATREPEETLAEVIGWFADRPVTRIGIGSFGPVDLKRGAISATTPKLNWRGVPIGRVISRALGAAATVDTDVNAAALAEHRWGAARRVRTFVYVTVGTGVGGGIMMNGELVHGHAHPEIGHLRVPRVKGDRFRGVCPLHGDCLEGMASGPAIARGSRNAASYLAWGLMNLTCALSPDLIVMGGGVMKTPGLLDEIRTRLTGELQGYVPAPRLVAPKLGDRAGVLGALALAGLDSDE
jgi:fructokinase